MQSSTVYQVTTDDLQEMIRQAVDAALTGYRLTPQSEPEIKYKTIAEICQEYRITAMTVHNLSIKGILKKHKIGRRVLYKSDEIEQAMQTQPALRYKRRVKA